jgi:hypothetical protein
LSQKSPFQIHYVTFPNYSDKHQHWINHAYRIRMAETKEKPCNAGGTCSSLGFPLFIYLFFFIFLLLFICAYKDWFISLLKPGPASWREGARRLPLPCFFCFLFIYFWLAPHWRKKQRAFLQWRFLQWWFHKEVRSYKLGARTHGSFKRILSFLNVSTLVNSFISL